MKHERCVEIVQASAQPVQSEGNGIRVLGLAMLVGASVVVLLVVTKKSGK